MSNPEARFNQAIKEILSGGLTRTVLSVILGFLVGAICSHVKIPRIGYCLIRFGFRSCGEIKQPQ